MIKKFQQNLLYCFYFLNFLDHWASTDEKSNFFIFQGCRVGGSYTVSHFFFIEFILKGYLTLLYYGGKETWIVDIKRTSRYWKQRRLGTWGRSVKDRLSCYNCCIFWFISYIVALQYFMPIYIITFLLELQLHCLFFVAFVFCLLCELCKCLVHWWCCNSSERLLCRWLWDEQKSIPASYLLRELLTVLISDKIYVMRKWKLYCPSSIEL